MMGNVDNGIQGQQGASTAAPAPARAQNRRAWRVLIACFLIFAVLVAGLGAGYGTYRANATRPRSGNVQQIASGSLAQVRARQQSFWHDVSEGSVLNEGDTLRTGEGTQMRVTLFDGTMVDLSANTEVTFDQLRASQYLDRNALVQLRQDHGRLVVTAGVDTTYSGVRVFVLTRGATVETHAPDTRFRVLVLPGGGGDPGRIDVSVLNGSDVNVQGAGTMVTVANGQQTVVAIGAAPSPPAVKQRELVENGTFNLSANAQDRLPMHWVLEQDDGGDGPGAPSTLAVVPDTIRGQPVNALHLLRTGGNFDSDLIGLRQTLAFSELDEFDSVVLSADVKVVSHSLSAGGQLGTEYPVIFLVRYVTAANEPVEKGRAFYTQNDDNNRTVSAVLTGAQIKPREWAETFHWDLKQIYPAPYRLVSIQVYASGHDYDAYVANVSIVAK